jgi:predicted ATPase
MARHFTRIDVVNYRCLQNVSVELGDVNVLFGPNGAGKSTFLDTVCFVRDCAAMDVGTASGGRNYGLGLRSDKAQDDAPVQVGMVTTGASYTISVGFSAGRMEPFAGERLSLVADGRVLVERGVGSKEANFWHGQLEAMLPRPLRDPDALSLGLYLNFSDRFIEATRMGDLLESINHYHSRGFNLYRLRNDGSTAGPEYGLSEKSDNLFSVLRNLQTRSAIDGRYDRVVYWMRRAFPGFRGLVLEQRGQGGVYCHFVQDGREPVAASGVADGHLQLLAVLTALYGGEEASIVLFDEPDLSLHPWAIATLADACREAAEKFGRQVLIATHSPVLLSQFTPDETLVFEATEGATRVTPASRVAGIQDLLDQYALGSLYMANVIAPQGDADAE